MKLCGDCEQLDYNGRNIYCAKSGLTMTGAFERIDKCKKESWKQPKAQETA